MGDRPYAAPLQSAFFKGLTIVTVKDVLTGLKKRGFSVLRRLGSEVLLLYFERPFSARHSALKTLQAAVVDMMLLVV